MIVDIELYLFHENKVTKNKQIHQEFQLSQKGRQINIIQMKKTLKVRKMIDQNGLQVDNYTMVVRLKNIINQLNAKIQHQQELIMELKRDTKTTKINQMQVEIQHLNDENKRLTIMIDQIKMKYKQEKIISNLNVSNISSGGNICDAAGGCLQVQLVGGSSNQNSNINKMENNCKSIVILNNNPSREELFKFNAHGKTQYQLSSGTSIKKLKKNPHTMLLACGQIQQQQSMFSINSALTGHTKKSYPQVQKQKEQQLKLQLKQKKFQKKYYELLEQQQKLKKELLNFKLKQPNSPTSKKRKTSFNMSTSDFDKTYHIFIQKNIQGLEKMTQKKNDLQVENDIIKRKLNENEKRLKELQKENEEIKGVLEGLKAQIKRKNLQYSETRIKVKKHPTLFIDRSYNSIEFMS